MNSTILNYISYKIKYCFTYLSRQTNTATTIAAGEFSVPMQTDYEISIHEVCHQIRCQVNSVKIRKTETV